MRAHVTSGGLSLIGLTGKTKASLVSGPVEAVAIGGDLEMETISGTLTLAEGSTGRVTARRAVSER